MVRMRINPHYPIAEYSSPEKVHVSMDGKGRAINNILVERLWRSLKYEDIYLKDYESVKALIDGLRRYFDFYNNVRSHKTLAGEPHPKLIGMARILKKQRSQY